MVDECSETRIHGLSEGQQLQPEGTQRVYRLGWNAMPLAREDFDSNCVARQR